MINDSQVGDFMRALILRIVLCVAALFGAAPVTLAQVTPPKLIKIVVPFSPGASNDVIARAIAGLLAKRLDTAVIVDNKVRIVATSGEQRNPLLPNVPTAKESGFPQYIVTSWNGLASAAGLPADVLAVLNGQINAALSDPALQETAAKLGIDAHGSTPEEMRDRMAADIQKWAAVIEKAGIEKQ